MNTATITGRLARSPQARTTTRGTSVSELRVAVNDRRNGSTSFITVEAYDKVADAANSHLSKGRLVGVTGRLIASEWTDQQGQWHSRVYIAATEVDFLDGPRPDTDSDTVGEDQADS